MGLVIGLGGRTSDTGKHDMIGQDALITERALHTALQMTGLRGLSNRFRYGAAAPLPRTHLKISPDALQARYFQTGNENVRLGHWRTGQVLAGDWDLSRRPLAKSLKFQACAAHFQRGKAWSDTPVFRYGLKRIAADGKYDDCKSLEDLEARYQSLDRLWELTAAAKALPATADVRTSPRTGILAHIDRNGQLLFGNQGFHRVAIAKLANISHVTVVLGVVHPGALKADNYQKLLRSRL